MKAILCFTLLAITAIFTQPVFAANYEISNAGYVRIIKESKDWTPVTKIEKTAIESPGEEFPAEITNRKLKRVDFFHNRIVTDYAKTIVYKDNCITSCDRKSQSTGPLEYSFHVFLFLTTGGLILIYTLTSKQDWCILSSFILMLALTFMLMLTTSLIQTTLPLPVLYFSMGGLISVVGIGCSVCTDHIRLKKFFVVLFYIFMVMGITIELFI